MRCSPASPRSLPLWKSASPTGAARRTKATRTIDFKASISAHADRSNAETRDAVAVLIAAGALKVGHPVTSKMAVQAYQIFPYELAGWIGLALPFAEIVLGTLLVLGLFTRVSAALATGLMILFVLGIASAWARGLNIDCGCFGGGGQIGAGQTAYPQEIARDLALVACGALLIRHPRTALALDSRLV